MDEQYLKLALSFMGGSVCLDDMQDESGFTDKTLSHKEAHGLDDAILDSMGVDDFGRPYFEPDVPRLHRVIEKITKGLCALRGWQTTDVSFKAVCLDLLSSLYSEPAVTVSAVSFFDLKHRKWIELQSKIFEYTLFRTTETLQGQAYCAMRLYDAVGTAVEMSNLRDADWRSAPVVAALLLDDFRS